MRRFAFALLLPLTACSVEQGKNPVIDDLAVPATATLASDGTYRLDSTISFHDDDDEVNRIRVHVESLDATAEYPATGGKSATHAPFTIQIAGTAPKGPLSLSVIVLDVAGNSSDTKTATVTLQ
ncbi:MAG: hypothetical protein ACXVEF_36350 [Polyangiales bacterium]